MLVNSEHQSKRSYVHDSRGNVAAIAALTIIPILCVAGIAIDFQMAITQKNKIQAIIDSAVIAGSKASSWAPKKRLPLIFVYLLSAGPYVR